MTSSKRFSHRTTLNVCKPASLLVGKMCHHCHCNVRFCKNVVVSKQVKNMVAVLAFFNQPKDSVTGNKNN